MRNKLSFMFVFIILITSCVAKAQALHPEKIAHTGRSYGNPSTRMLEFEFTKEPATATNKILITSDSWFRTWAHKDIISDLENIINSGEYNITAVRTTYARHHYWGYLLTSAEVSYDAFSHGDGNKIRASFLCNLNVHYYYDQRQEILEASIDRLQEYDVEMTNIIETYIFERCTRWEDCYFRHRWYTLNAEVYYRKK